MKASDVYLPETDQGKKEFLRQAYEVEKIIHSPGWKILRNYWHHLRENILSEIESAKSDRKFQYYQGQLKALRQTIETVDQILADAETMKADLENQEDVNGPT